tara:strand:- start:238 stop:819 length:582 start_codon:yes stop_codon:yes gene_type:complete
MTVQALVDGSGTIVNRVMVAPDSDFEAPAGLTIVSLEGVSPEPAIGWHYSGGVFTAPAAPAPDMATLRAAAHAAVEAKRDAILSAGYQHNFGGSAGVRTLDNRNEVDAINWLGLKGIVDAKIASGDGEDLLSLRDAGNDIFTVSAATIASALIGMAVWRASVLAVSWTLKDAIAAAEDEAALAAIDLDAGWPA